MMNMLDITVVLMKCASLCDAPLTERYIRDVKKSVMGEENANRMMNAFYIYI